MFSAADMLKDDKAVKLAPDTQGLFDMVHEVSRELIGVVKEVPRLGPEDTEDEEELPTFYDVISGDEDAALKQIIAIDSGLGKIVNPVATFVARWEASYRHVWETDKDQFIARYTRRRNRWRISRRTSNGTRRSWRRSDARGRRRQPALPPH